MINNVFPLPQQTAIQASAETFTVTPFSSTAAFWVDRVIIRSIYS